MISPRRSLIALALLAFIGVRAEAQVTFVAAESNASPGMFSVNVPAGTVAGDVLLAFLWSDAPAGAFIVPAGWTIASTGTTPAVSMVFLRVADGTEPAAYVFSHDDADVPSLVGTLLTYRGVDTTTPIDDAGAAASLSAPSLTTTVANTMLVAGWRALLEEAIPVTEPAGMTSRANPAVSGSSATRVADELFGGPGATGVRTADCGVGDTCFDRHSHMLALVAASATMPPPVPTLSTPALMLLAALLLLSAVWLARERA